MEMCIMTAKPLTSPATVSSANQLLRINDVVALTTLSKSCVNLWVAQGRFPKPIALSSTLKVWRSSDLSDWIDRQFTTVGEDCSIEQSGNTAALAQANGRLK
jgi:predicted DNA-binding transcriptional regulator AlpA